MQPFIRLNKARIGLPTEGYGYLFINLSALNSILVQRKRSPKSSQWGTNHTLLADCQWSEKLLLKVTKVKGLEEENHLADGWESLAAIFGNAVRCPIGKAIGLAETESGGQGINFFHY